MLGTVTRLTGTALDLWRGLDSLDRKAVRKRIGELRRRNKGKSLDDLHRDLVWARCLQAGAIGATSEIAGLVPGLGPVLGRILGPMADATLVSALQAELIAETFALYEVELPPQAEQAALLGLVASHTGAQRAGDQVAKVLVGQTEKWLGGFVARGALPVARAAASVVTHIAVTYAIGMRARALSKMTGARLDEWPELLRSLAMVDERRLTRWATDAARGLLEQGGKVMQGWSGSLSVLANDVRTRPAAKPRKSRRRRARASV